MIISHKHRFIYLKTRKTAGSAFQIGLARHCGPDDILSEFHDEGTKETGYQPRNHEGWIAHQSAIVIAQRLPEAWRDYRKVVVVRAPLEKVYSYYWWQKMSDPGFGDKHTFEEWFWHSPSAGHWHDPDVLAINGRYFEADVVARQERLQADFEDATEVLFGQRDKTPLPRCKAAIRQDRRPASIHFTPRMLSALDRLFSAYCMRYGYPLPSEERRIICAV